MRELILASASPRRREILERMGLSFTVMPSRCEERRTESDPEKLVLSLALQKAEDTAKEAPPGALILGADTIVVLDGKILGKPKDRREAADMLAALSGRTHLVYTGVALLAKADDGSGGISRAEKFAVRTEVCVAPMDGEEIGAYLDTGEYRDKAGAYGIQGRFAPYITEIRGDYYNVMGLPAAELYRRLKTFA